MAINFPSSPTNGQSYTDPTSGVTWVYSSSTTAWSSSFARSGYVNQVFTATAGQTSFTIAGGYSPSLVQVYQNGVLLVNGTDVTVTSGTSVVLAVGATVGDQIQVLGLSTFSVTGTINATTVSDSLGNLRAVPQNAQTGAYVLVASDAGKHISITTGGVTVNSGIFSVGDNVTIYNNSASSQTITQGTSVTLRQVGTTNTGNRTLASYGLCTLLCVASNTFVITGGGLS